MFTVTYTPITDAELTASGHRFTRVGYLPADRVKWQKIFKTREDAEAEIQKQSFGNPKLRHRYVIDEMTSEEVWQRGYDDAKLDRIGYEGPQSDDPTYLGGYNAFNDKNPEKV